MPTTKETTVSSEAGGNVRTVRIDTEPGKVLMTYQGENKTSASVTVVDGRTRSSDLRGKPAVRRALAAELTRLQELDGSKRTAYDYAITSQDPSAEIDWECEIATLKAIVVRGTGQILECGAAVHKQWCECAPKDSEGNKPHGCD